MQEEKKTPKVLKQSNRGTVRPKKNPEEESKKKPNQSVAVNLDDQPVGKQVAESDQAEEVAVPTYNFEKMLEMALKS